MSRVDQLILQNFIEQGYFERHLNKSRALYKGRHDALLAALKPLQDLCTISGEHAGVHLLLHFPELEEEETDSGGREKRRSKSTDFRNIM